jgi:hypothetical protein
MKAFCLKAPTVRFVNLAIVFAGVFSREWFFNSRKSSFVHSRPRTLILPPPEPETLAVFRIKRAIHAPRIYLRLLRARRKRPRRRRTAETQKTISPAASGSAYSYVPCQAQVAPQPVLSTSSLEVVNAMIVQR